MGSKLVCQLSFGPTRKQDLITDTYHRYFCGQYGYEFLKVPEPISTEHPYWQKVRFLKTLVELGHTDIVWLDADAFWLGKYPLAPELNGKPLGVVKHVSVNAGVLYLKGTQAKLLALLNDWLESPDDGHPSKDNRALNNLLDRGVHDYQLLPVRYNSQRTRSHCKPGEENTYTHYMPIVEAWHGVKTRHLRMREYIDDRYWGLSLIHI